MRKGDRQPLYAVALDSTVDRLMAAARAPIDSMLLRFLIERLEIAPEDAAGVVQDFRAWCDENQTR